MARKKIAGGPTSAAPEPNEPQVEDTEGHSMGLLLAMTALGEADRSMARDRTQHAPVEELPPLTRTFPNMRSTSAGPVSETAAVEIEEHATSGSLPLPNPSQA